MKKIVYILIIIFAFTLPSKEVKAQCTYTFSLYDSNGDGWRQHYSWFWGRWIMDEYVTVYVNGTELGSARCSASATNITVSGFNDGDVVQMSYGASGIDDYQNAFDVTDQWGNIVASGGNPMRDADGSIGQFIVHCTQPSSNPSQGNDCGWTETVCSDDAISSGVIGPGNHYELDLTNEGCLYDEHQTFWTFFHAEMAGTIGLTITPNDMNDDYDFAIWSGTDCSPSSTPIRCSWAGVTGVTGLGNGATENHEDEHGDGWVATINASAGDEFLLLVDNWSYSNNGFTLTWDLPDGATLDCDPLPVSYIPMEYDCNNKELRWQTLTEINNDYFTIETGNSFDIDGNLILEDIYVVSGNGTTNSITDYIYNIDLKNKYVVLLQVDYDGSTTKLETKYYSCENNEQSIIRLMPNPASASSIVNIDGEYNKAEVYDIIGNKVDINISNNQILGLSKGLYLVRFDDNQSIKLIIQ